MYKYTSRKQKPLDILFYNLFEIFFFSSTKYISIRILKKWHIYLYRLNRLCSCLNTITYISSTHYIYLTLFYSFSEAFSMEFTIQVLNIFDAIIKTLIKCINYKISYMGNAENINSMQINKLMSRSHWAIFFSRFICLLYMQVNWQDSNYDHEKKIQN